MMFSLSSSRSTNRSIGWDQIKDCPVIIIIIVLVVVVAGSLFDSKRFWILPLRLCLLVEWCLLLLLLLLFS
jgi:hypothetical protein